MQIAGVGADLLRQAGRDVGAQLGRGGIREGHDEQLVRVHRVDRVGDKPDDALDQYAGCLLYTSMVIYLTMTLFASYLLRLWEKALDGPQNYDLNTTDSLAYTSGCLLYTSRSSARAGT